MGKLTGKIIEASEAKSVSDIENVGPALKNLRVLSSLTQSDMAERLNIQQAAVSKIEKGGDTHLSTVKKYVEALGASLQIGASFQADTPLALHIREAFDVEYGDDNQLVLPILEDEPFRPQRDIVISIRPQYSDKIIEGLKTVELRRRFPVSAPSGTIAYIYSTSPTRAMVGSASIKNVLKLSVDELWQNFENNAYIKKDDFDKYFEGVDHGFALLFEDVRPFSRPIPLTELREDFGFQPPQSFLYAKQDLRKALNDKSSIVSH